MLHTFKRLLLVLFIFLKYYLRDYRKKSLLYIFMHWKSMKCKYRTDCQILMNWFFPRASWILMKYKRIIFKQNILEFLVGIQSHFRIVRSFNDHTQIFKVIFHSFNQVLQALLLNGEKFLNFVKARLINRVFCIRSVELLKSKMWEQFC